MKYLSTRKKKNVKCPECTTFGDILDFFIFLNTD